MIEEDKKWYTKKVTMFNEEAFKLGHAYHLWHTLDDGKIEHYNAILYSKGQEELWFKATCTDNIGSNHRQCDVKDINIKYHHIEDWDFSLLTLTWEEPINEQKNAE